MQSYVDIKFLSAAHIILMPHQAICRSSINKIFVCS